MVLFGLAASFGRGVCINVYCRRSVAAIALVASVSLVQADAGGSSTPTTGQGAAPSVAPQASPHSVSGVTPATGATGSTASSGAGGRLQFVIGENNVVRVPGLSLEAITVTTTLSVSGIPGLEKMTSVDVDKLARSLTVVDRGLARGAPVPGSFTFASTPELVGRSGTNGLTWRLAIKVGIPPGTSQLRVAAATLASPEVQSHALEFTVSAKPASTSQWTPRGATDIWTVSWSDIASARVFGITIENPDEQISNIQLVQSTLKDSAGRSLGVERLRLVDSPDGDGKAQIDAPGSGTRKLFVRFEDGQYGPYGTFDGVLRLAADGSPTMKDVSLKVQASSDGRRLLGVVCTVAGLLLTVFVTVIARPRMARLQARRAAAAVRQGFRQLAAELEAAIPENVVEMNRMGDVMKGLYKSITDDTLDDLNLLPPRFLRLPGSDAPPDIEATLKAKLDGVSQILEGLLVLVRVGAPPIAKLLTALATRDAGVKLALELDAFAEEVTGPQNARTKAEELRTRAAERRGAENAAISRGATEREVTVKELDLEIKGLSYTAWFVWALVSLVIGGAWVFTKVDYGTTMDLVSSFAWGFGLTTFGAGIQTLTPNSIATQMNVKVPR